MPLCIVNNCKNNSNLPNNNAGISYHKFPKDENMRNKWIEIIRECRKDDSFYPSAYSIVCSIHFKAADRYNTKNGLHLLRKHALPTENLTNADKYQCEVLVVENNNDDDDDLCIPTEILEETTALEQSLEPALEGPEPEPEPNKLMEIQLKNEIKKFNDFKSLMKRKFKMMEQRVHNLTKTNNSLKTKLRQQYAIY